MGSQKQTRCSSGSRISPCQVKELELLGALSCCCSPCSGVELCVPQDSLCPNPVPGEWWGWGELLGLLCTAGAELSPVLYLPVAAK